MITIVAKNIIKQGMTKKFKAAVKPLIEASQKEGGCISYNLYEDVSDPSVLTFIEQWEDQEAIDRHNNSAHFTQIVPTLSAFRTESEVRLYKII